MTTTEHRPTRRVVFAVLGLLVLHFALAIASSARKSMTHDEIVHMAGGVSYWLFDDYRLHPENGNLPQRWAAIPLVATGYTFPDTGQQAWDNSRAMPLGDQFVRHPDNDLDAMLFRGRSFIALLSTALCAVAFFWSRALFGTTGALLTLALCALSPTLLAHGRLITSDTCLALFMALSVWCAWRTLERTTILRTLAGSVSLGCLFVSKMSAPIVIPVVLVMVIMRLRSPKPMLLALGTGRREVAGLGGRVLLVGGIGLVHAIVTWAIVWASFGFRYETAPQGDKQRFSHYESLEEATGESSLAGSTLRFLADNRILPEAYLYGAALVLAKQDRVSFLNGEYSKGGFFSFFPFCLATKTPLPLFGLLLASAAAWWFGRRRRPGSETALRVSPLWALIIVYWCAVLSSPLNIGHRHILPTFVPMFVLAGGATRWWGVGKPVVAAVVSILAGLFAFESARAYPDYLAYFNGVVSRENAYRHMIASSLDWGQDLPALRDWLDENRGDRRVHFAYFGTAQPESYDIESEYVPVADWLPRDRKHKTMGSLRPGLYCISATALQAVHAAFPGTWTDTYERIYQSVRPWGEQLEAPGAEKRADIPDAQQVRALLAGYAQVELRNSNYARHVEAAENWMRAYQGNRGPQALAHVPINRRRQPLASLRAARLFAHLRQREPDHQVGYSILIYDVSDAELRQALEGPPPE